MAVSGTCAVIAGFLFGANPILLAAFCFVWGLAVVADSAQFSASIAELSEPCYVGTMQTCAGFLLAIHLISPIVDAVGWQLAFASLCLGPFSA